MLVLFHKHVWLYSEYMPTLHWWTGASSVWPYYNCCMRNHIRHNYPSLIHCLQAFHILFFAYLLFRCYCYNYYKNPKTFIFTFAIVTFIIIPLLLLNTLMQILSYPGVVELTTQLLILKNIIWLPLCRINKFGLNTLPSKTLPIPYTCGLSGMSRGGWCWRRDDFGSGRIPM